MDEHHVQLYKVLQQQIFLVIRDLSILNEIIPDDNSEIKNRVKELRRKAENLEIVLENQDNKKNLDFLLKFIENITEVEKNRNAILKTIEDRKDNNQALARAWEMFQHEKKQRSQRSQDDYEKIRQNHVLKTRLEFQNNTAVDIKSPEEKTTLSNASVPETSSLKKREISLAEKEKKLEELASQEHECPDARDKLLKRANLSFDHHIADQFLQILQSFREQQANFYKTIGTNIEDSIDKAREKQKGIIKNRSQQQSQANDNSNNITDTDYTDKLSGKENNTTNQVGGNKNTIPKKDKETKRKKHLSNKAVKTLDKHFLSRLINFAHEIRQRHFDFLTKNVRKSISYINRWKESDPASLNKEDKKKLNDIEQEIKDIFREAKQAIEAGVIMRGHEKSQQYIKDHVSDLDAQDQARILVNDRLAEISAVLETLQSYYHRGITWWDILFDAQFLSLYGVKIINVAVFALAVYVSTVIFKKKYKKDVFETHKGPSSLFMFTGMILGFFLLFNLFIFMLLILFVYLFQHYNFFSFVNGYLVSSYVVDLTMSVILMIGVYFLLTYFVSRKRYFNYKIGSYKTIHALGRMLFFISIWILMNPFFYFYWIINKDSLL